MCLNFSIWMQKETFSKAEHDQYLQNKLVPCNLISLRINDRKKTYLKPSEVKLSFQCPFVLIIKFNSTFLSILSILDDPRYSTRDHCIQDSILGCFGQSGLQRKKIQTAISMLLLRSVLFVFMARKNISFKIL